MTLRNRLFAGFFLSGTLLLFLRPDLGECREAGWVPLQKGSESVMSPAKKTGQISAKKDKIAGSPKEAVKKGSAKILPRQPGSTVYDKQGIITEPEIQAFVELLPRFRAWARKNGEEAHPVVNKSGKPDFLYSPLAAKWVADHGFEPARFFCVMGKLAAGLVIVEEGNDLKGTIPADMPAVSQEELNLVRKHLGELLSAGGPPQPMK